MQKPAHVPDAAVARWLLDPSQPSMRYLVMRDLVSPRPSMVELQRLRSAIPRRGWAARLLARQRERTWWVWRKTCYYPKFRSGVWVLQVLADLGLTRENPRIENAAEFFLKLHYDSGGGGYRGGALSEEGRLFYTDIWGGTWAHYSHLCLTGNMVRSLIRFGYLDDPRVRSAIDWLVDEQYADGGWDCFGRRRGTIDAWEAMSALAAIPSGRRSAAVRNAIRRGAGFFLKKRLLHEGKRFERWYWCRYPWHYHYDHLVGLDFMTALGYGRNPRLREALDNLESRRRPDGRWNVDHTNGNLVLEHRKRASKMITFLATRVLQRADRVKPLRADEVCGTKS